MIYIRYLYLELKKQNEEEIHEERDTLMRLEYFHTIENFPDKVDQLLDGINRVYVILFRFYFS